MTLPETGGNSPTLCISRGRTCEHTHAHVQTRIMHASVKRYTPSRYKKQQKHGKIFFEITLTKAINQKNIRKRRKWNHQSTIKTMIFASSMTNKASENSHRRYIFSRDSRHFLCFPFVKRMFPMWKTYVSRQENIRFPWRKHRNLKYNEGLSHRHFFNTERLKGKKRST